MQFHLSVLGAERDDEEHPLPRSVAPITLCFLPSWFSIFNHGFHSLSSLVSPEDFLKEEAFNSHKVTFITDPSQVVLVVKNLPASAGDKRDSGLIPGLGRSPRGGYGDLLQYSCLGNPMDRGAAKSWTRLKQLSTHTNCENTEKVISKGELEVLASHLPVSFPVETQDQGRDDELQGFSLRNKEKWYQFTGAHVFLAFSS